MGFLGLALADATFLIGALAAEEVLVLGVRLRAALLRGVDFFTAGGTSAPADSGVAP